MLYLDFINFVQSVPWGLCIARHLLCAVKKGNKSFIFFFMYDSRLYRLGLLIFQRNINVNLK